MKYVKIMGLCLVAALALSVVAATAASAKPYGFYKDGTEEAATGYKYKGKLTGGIAKLVTPKNGTIECEGATGSGEIKELNKAEGEIIFTKCTFAGFPCQSTEPAGKEGEIITREITTLAVLERLSSGEKQPALLFKPLKETKLECAGIEKLTIANGTGENEKVKVLGGLLVLLPKAASEGNGWLGTNNEGKLFDLEFKQKEGKQEGSNKEGFGEFIESETGEAMKSGVTTTGSGLTTFKETSAEEAKLSIESEKAISIFA
jgi:hypothetical protein